jgi:GTP cyclohydrolase II
LTGARDVARAIDALRRGWPVAVDDVLFLAVETADADGLAGFDGNAPADLLISGHRAETLKLTNQRDAVPADPVLVRRSPWLDLAAATAVADPALDLAVPLKCPCRTGPLCSPPTARAALRLARLAGLLPALFTRRGGGEAEARVAAADIAAFGAGADVRIVSRAHLPNRFAAKAEIVAFRSDGDTAEPVALLIGEPGGEAPLVRVHSECLTGDALASLKCDCGPQLGDAIGAIAAAGWGILIYLRQEGRGIGLVNKLRAYALQDQGFDTVDANLRLGFADDERDFSVAARMLERLGQRRIRLLTNNPRKASALAAEGIEVIAQVPLKVAPGEHNRFYLDTKRDRSGHQL